MNKSLIIAAALMTCAAGTALADEMQFGYCSDVVQNNIGGLTPGYYVAGAIEIPAETAETWKGNILKAVNVGFGEGKTRVATVFITDKLENEPFYEQQVELANKNEWNMFTLDTPYTFTGEKVFVGYYMRTASTSDYPIGVDDIVETASPYGDWIATGSGKKTMRDNWEHGGDNFGNVALRIVIEGNNLPHTNAVTQNIKVPVVVKPGEQFDLSGIIYNRGVDPITSFSADVRFGDEPVQTCEYTMPEPLVAGTSTAFTLQGLVIDNEALDIPVTVTLTKVNGADNESVDVVSKTVTNCSEYAWPRVMVCEEGTGLWCGNCPRGIVGLREMSAKYGDKFIGIAVHDSQDRQYGMYVAAYQPIINMMSAFPMSVINRTFNTDPEFSNLETVYDIEINKPVFATMQVDAQFVDDTHKQLTATATTTFGADLSDVDYRIAFVLTEDQVGPFQQANNYAGGKLGEMGGFEDMDSYAVIMLDHVARYISNVYGNPDSSVTSATKGETVSYSYTIDIPEEVRDTDNLNVIAMLIDNGTSERPIYTAVERTLSDCLGVTEVTADADADAPVEYYNLQGVRVNNPAAGQIVIRRQGSTVTKVLVK